jgi:chromosome segregation ATPase
MGTENLGDMESTQKPQLQRNSHLYNPLIVLLPHDTSLCKRQFYSPLHYDNAFSDKVEGALQLIAHNPHARAQVQKADILYQPITPSSFSAFRLPYTHISNFTQAGLLSTASYLLIQRDKSIHVMEACCSELSALTGAVETQGQLFHQHAHTLDHYRVKHSAVSMQELETQQTEIENLKQTLSEVKKQYDAQIKQRDIEKNLLTQALTVTMKHLKEYEHNIHSPTDLDQDNPILGEYLREEIAEVSQPDKIPESQHESHLESQQIQNELRRPQDELAEQLKKSEASRKQLKDEITRLSKERFDLESSLNELRSQLDGQRSNEEMQISTLQQSLNETQEALDQAKAAHHKREQELQEALDETTNNAEQTAQALGNEIEQLQQVLTENSAQLSQAKAEQQALQSSLQAELEKTDRSIEEINARYEDQIATLQQQIQTHESSHRQLAQEKAELASCLQAEASRALEFARQAESLDKLKLSLEHELETTQQSFREAVAQYQNEMALLKEDLQQARHTIDKLEQSRQQLEQSRQQLESELQHTQAEHQAEQERFNHALEAEKLYASKNDRLKKLVNELKSRVELTRAKAILQRKKRIRLEAMLAREQEASVQIKQLLTSAKEKAELANSRIAEMELSQQELQIDLQMEIKASHEAWEKASESDIALQVATQEHASFKDEIEQEVDNLRAQLEHQDENLKIIQSNYLEEKVQLQQSLDESQDLLKAAQATIRALKSDRQAIREAKSEVDKQLERLEEESRKEQTELRTALESSQKEAASLSQELADINGLLENTETLEHLRLKLEQAENEKAALNQQVSELMKAEKQQCENRDTEITKLRNALMAEEEKRKTAEKLAQQREALQRELQIQEIAVDALSEDLDILVKEKTVLTDERDRLQRELSDIKRIQ